MRKATLAGAGLALIMTVTACGGGQTGGQAEPAPANGDRPFNSAPDLVRAASTKTAESKTAKFSMEAGGAGQSMTATGQLRFDPGNVAMSMNMDNNGEKMEIRLVDRAFFIKSPEMSEGGKEWTKLSTDGADPLSKLLGTVLDQAAKQSDPTKVLDQIDKAGTITKTEPTQLDGQPATLYNVDVDVAKAMQLSLESMPKELTDALKGKLETELKGKQLTMPMQLWLNADQLPVQIVVDSGPMAAAMGAPAGQAEAKSTMKYTDWGAPVDVQAPPADQVQDLKMPEIPGMPPTQPTR
ncbi:hypothetical protein [Amycolatopsis nigrescens]|uniref:hypothetical protein n=1 Tax=Amycolatopsis nigrescens TaxID=381445 RepID=UPI00035C312C|nr:hypothetical protein [Amycolatopsis nigrescens]